MYIVYCANNAKVKCENFKTVLITKKLINNFINKLIKMTDKK